MAAHAATDLMVHGTAVAFGGRAALLRGPSGSGKSDLALRAIAMPETRFAHGTFELVADDQVRVTRAGETLTVSPPPQLAGLIEVRGLGIMAMSHRNQANLVLLVNLVDRREVERLPDPWPDEMLCEVRLPVLRLAPFEASAPMKLAAALTMHPWLRSDD